MPVERTMTFRERAKNAVKKIEADAVVLIHLSALVDGVVVNVMEPPGVAEPRTQ